jgi:hypothetical protein
MTKEKIRDGMMRHLAEQLESFLAENAEVTTRSAWDERVTFSIDSKMITAIRERILQSAQDRLVLAFVLLTEKSLNPERLDGFVQGWLNEAKKLLEEQANAVTFDL